MRTFIIAAMLLTAPALTHAEDDAGPKATEVNPKTVVLGNQPITDGMRAETHQRLAWYRSSASSVQGDVDASDNRVVIEAHRTVRVEEMAGDRPTKAKLSFGDVKIDVAGSYKEEDFRSVLDGHTYLVDLSGDDIVVTHKNGKAISVEEARALLVEEAAIIRPSSFAWLRGAAVSPGDSLVLNPATDDLFQQLLETGQAVTGQLTYRGTTMRDGHELAEFDLGLVGVREGEHGGGEMAVRGRIWVTVKTGWIHAIDMKGALQGDMHSSDASADIKVMYENSATFAYRF